MKKILGKWLLATLFLLSSVGGLWAYTATDEDKATVTALRNQLMSIIGQNNEDLWSFYYQIRSLQNQYTFTPQLDYMLEELKTYLWSIMQGRKQQAKIFSRDHKEAFYNAYSGDIMKDEAMEEYCVGWYNTLDDIAFSHDYPTAVLIATWYRETTCGYYLPQNGDGPFQITSKDYGTGDITESAFVQSVIDFINFSKAKYERYEKANQDSGYQVPLDYQTITKEGIVRHGALYNGLSGYTVYSDAKPLNPRYVWDLYGEEYSGASRYGLFPQTLRVVRWELDNKY